MNRADRARMGVAGRGGNVGLLVLTGCVSGVSQTVGTTAEIN